MKVKKVKDLKPGEKFIWADNHTRDVMGVNPSRNCAANPDCEYHRVQVLEAVKVSGNMIRFRFLDGKKDSLFYNSACRVILVTADDGLGMNFGVRCEDCGQVLGNHYPGKNVTDDGICCGFSKSQKWFVPSEESLREFYPSQFSAADDFFESLGL